MKKLLQTTLLVCSLLFVASCSSDDPEPIEGSGTWELESFILNDFPDAFASNEGTPVEISGISFGGYAYESYTLELNNDKTYDRTVGLQGAPSVIDNGVWVIAGDDLILENAEGEDEFSQEFDIVSNEEKQLWISQEVTFGGFYRDDTLAALNTRYDGDVDAINEYLNSLSDADFAKYLNDVSIDLVYAFIKE